MSDTDFLRSDELPGRTALGYVPIDGTWRTNVFHLPVRGTGDGGIYSTVADLRRLWTALFAGRLVGADTVAHLVRARSDVPREGSRYGLGFWLAPSGPAVTLIGCDTGVSCFSTHDPDRALTYSVVSNTADGADPVYDRLAELLTDPT